VHGLRAVYEFALGVLQLIHELPRPDRTRGKGERDYGNGKDCVANGNAGHGKLNVVRR